MKVAHIAYIFGEQNTGGAAIASTRLHKALLSHGVESHYVCVRKMEDGENVHELPVGWKQKLFLFLTKVMRRMWKFTPYHKSICMNLVPLFGLERLLKRLNPDVVHVHWLNADVASFEQISKLPFRVVFNLHDLFVINALEPCPYADRRFIEGFNHSNSSWLERYLFNRKRNMISKLKASFIGPSRWVCEQCKISIIGRGYDVYEVSNLIAPDYFAKLRNSASIRTTKFTILFGAYGGRKNADKGFPDLVAALQQIPQDIKRQCILKIYGEEAEDCDTEGVKTEFLGKISSAHQMIEILNSADIFAFPSRAETQGMTKVEALICGVPVIAFERTACSEGIVHEVNGWIADDGDIASYSRGIVYFFQLWQAGEIAQKHAVIAKIAKEQYDSRMILDKIILVYSNI